MRLHDVTASLVPPQYAPSSPDPQSTLVLEVQVNTSEGVRGIGTCPLAAHQGPDALQFIARHRTLWCDELDGLQALRVWVLRHAVEIDRHCAAWYAVEIALLDALGLTRGQSLEALLGLRSVRAPRCITVILSDHRPHAFDDELAQLICGGHRQFALPLSGDAMSDQLRIEALEAGDIRGTCVRADVDGLWSDPGDALDYLMHLDYPFWAVQEPLSRSAIAHAPILARALRLRIVLEQDPETSDLLDVLPMKSAECLISIDPIRMGGLLRTLTFVARAHGRGIGVVLGSPQHATLHTLRATLGLASQWDATLPLRTHWLLTTGDRPGMPRQFVQAIGERRQWAGFGIPPVPEASSADAGDAAGPFSTPHTSLL